MSNQLPKVETYGDQLFVISRTANLDGDTIQPGETAFFIGPHFFVSVRHGSARTHTDVRSEEHTSELQSLMRISYAVFCLKKNKPNKTNTQQHTNTHTRHTHTT